MKKLFKTMPLTIGIAMITALNLTSCYEGNYVRRYNHHSRNWYGRRHVDPPVGINFEIEERRRHR